MKNNFSSPKQIMRMFQKNKALNEKQQPQQKAKQWVANEEPPSLKKSVEELTNIEGNTTSYSINGIKVNARTPIEQNVSVVLKNLKLKNLVQPHKEVLVTIDPRYKHDKKIEDRNILKNGLLIR